MGVLGLRGFFGSIRPLQPSDLRIKLGYGFVDLTHVLAVPGRISPGRTLAGQLVPADLKSVENVLHAVA